MDRRRHLTLAVRISACHEWIKRSSVRAHSLGSRIRHLKRHKAMLKSKTPTAFERLWTRMTKRIKPKKNWRLRTKNMLNIVAECIKPSCLSNWDCLNPMLLGNGLTYQRLLHASSSFLVSGRHEVWRSLQPLFCDERCFKLRRRAHTH